MDTIIEILIDNSNSMGPFETDPGKYLLPDGSTRMELVKKILIEEIIPKLDYAKKVTLRKFHSTGADKTTVPVIDIVYEGILDKVLISSKVGAVAIPNNTGGTPITAAVKQPLML